MAPVLGQWRVDPLALRLAASPNRPGLLHHEVDQSARKLQFRETFDEEELPLGIDLQPDDLSGWSDLEIEHAHAKFEGLHDLRQCRLDLWWQLIFLDT